MELKPIGDKPASPETKYPIGWAILQELRHFVNSENTSFLGLEDEDVFRSLYLTERGECVPFHLVGEDLMVDIINLYYHVFDAVADELRSLVATEDIQVYVQPFYYDVTFALMVTESRVLLKHSSKPWDFWWPTEEDMAQQLEEWYRTAEKALAETSGSRR